MSRAEVVVIGAGVIGVTTAYYLTRLGYRVQVIDKNTQAADECSFANGGFLSLAHAAPWAQPGITRVMLQSFFDENSPAKWQFDGSVMQLRWLWDFYKNSSVKKFQKNKKALYNLAEYSKECLKIVLSEHNLIPVTRSGVVQITQKMEQLPALKKQQQSYRNTTVSSRILVDKTELCDLEPAFKHSQSPDFCGLFIENDYAADCHAFTQNLAKYLEGQGVRFNWGVHAQQIYSMKDSASVYTSKGEFKARYIVVCAGVGSEHLLEPEDRPTVYPVKGYALTVPVKEVTLVPTHPIVDGDSKVAISLLGGQIRITAIAEIVGTDKRINPKRIEQMKASYERLFPDSVDWSQAKPWVGFRPTRPSAVPLIGPLQQDNVFINTGHGAYGWTLACGSAQLLAHQLHQQPTEISSQDYLHYSQ